MSDERLTLERLEWRLKARFYGLPEGEYADPAELTRGALLEFRCELRSIAAAFDCIAADQTAEEEGLTPRDAIEILAEFIRELAEIPATGHALRLVPDPPKGAA